MFQKQDVESIIQPIKIWFVVIVQVFALPLSLATVYVNAQETSSDSTTDTVASTPVIEDTTPVVEQTEVQGPTEPTGDENRSYTYNESTGLWENDYYTWDPVTKLTTPKQEQTYSYNPETGFWDTTKWVYTPETGTYSPQKEATTQTTEKSEEPPVSTSKLDSNSSTPETYKTPISLLSNPTKTNGPGALSVSTYDSNNGSYFNNFFNANISVSVQSSAISGNASVLQNTIGGSALTGDATAIATIMNIIQSAWGVGGLMPYLYTENIQGDYFGDIFLDPTLLTVQNANKSNDLIVNSSQDVAIVNDIELNAQSGNSLVQSNTEAGDATTGDATAILNLMNVINSSISAGQSFVAMLNIFGNLEGDVLIPDNLLGSLLASNIPTAEIQLSSDTDSSFILNNNNSQTIDNDIVVSAKSGDATVTNNTNAGNATSGNADTSVTVFNLTGSQVIAEQAMLVFVQVMGEWIGFITNAPAGSNVALLGGGVQSNQNTSSNTEFNIDNKSYIDNNIAVNAATGSASVLENTTAGSAATGDAQAIANIANITNSTFSLSNWFGLLFINVLGNWSGSFGTNTPFGSIISAVSNPSSNSTNSAQAANNTPNVTSLGAGPSIQNVRVFAVTIGANSSGGTSVTSATPVMEEDVPPPTVLEENDKSLSVGVLGDTDSNTPASTRFYNLLIGSLVAGAIILFLNRRYRTV